MNRQPFTNSVVFAVIACAPLSTSLLHAETRPVQEHAAQEHAAQVWGSVAGQVIFSGPLDVAAVKDRQQPLAIYEMVTLHASRQGDRPKVKAHTPSQSLLINQDSKGIQNVFVYLKSRPESIRPQHPRRPSRALVYSDYAYSPRALSLQTGQQLQLVNHDTKEAEVFHGEFFRNAEFNRLVKPGQNDSVVLPKAEKFPHRIRNSKNTTAQAWALVVDHPYVAITDQHGRFRIDQLPVGQHKLVFWHESCGYINKELTVNIAGNETTTLPQQTVVAKQLK